MGTEMERMDMVGDSSGMEFVFSSILHLTGC